MISIRSGITALDIAVLLGTQGCAAQPGGQEISSLTVEEAKGEAQSTEDDIAALIPSESVTRMEQAPTGGLLSCKGESTYQWYGHTFVDLGVGVDPEGIVDDLVDKWRDDKSFTVSTRTDLSDTPVLRLRGKYNSSYFVTVSESGSQISIISFSPCFALPTNADPGARY